MSEPHIQATEVAVVAEDYREGPLTVDVAGLIKVLGILQEMKEKAP